MLHKIKASRGGDISTKIESGALIMCNNSIFANKHKGITSKITS